MEYREMNEIETLFYKAYREVDQTSGEDIYYELKSQQSIGIYLVDFVYGSCAVEIDGHEYHKTKEQREYDYKRDRYLLKRGYTVIRFMATEVFLDAKKCVLELLELGNDIGIRDETVFNLCKEHDVETIWGIPLINSKNLIRGNEHG